MAAHESGEIDPHELRRRLESGDAIEVVDIREAAEFEGWHIQGSRNLPVYDDLRANRPEPLVAGAADLPHGRPLVTVCRAGVISRRAAQVLQALGRDARSLTGGIRGWGSVWTEAPIDLAGRDGAALVQIRRNGKGCLSYLLGHDGQAAVVDPSVDIAAYVDAAKARGLTIAQVFETHVHADHLSRARELCRATGADLLMPVNDRAKFPHVALKDGDRRSVGGIDVEAIATPGHTGESMCYRIDGQVLLTGDTLFPASVGRPDLERGNAGAERGARELFRSLHQRLLDGHGDLRFFAAHCGQPIGFDGRPIGGTLDAVRSEATLLQLDEAAFVARILERLGPKPPNFESVIAVNEGRAELGEVDPLDLEAGPNRCAAG